MLITLPVLASVPAGGFLARRVLPLRFAVSISSNFSCIGSRASSAFQEVAFSLDQLLDERERLRLSLDRIDRAEDILVVTDFIVIAQGPDDNSLVERLQHHGPLAAIQDEAGQTGHCRRLHRVPDHREGFLADRIVGREIMRPVEPDRIDAGGRNEPLDVDRSRALERDALKLVILHEDEFVLGLRISLDEIVLVDGSAVA